jgi:hypothetical protein
MSSAESFNPDRSKVDQPNGSQSAPAIETVYTTVESQAARTDWLTVVSNLRHSERQLVEQIARLEQALASAKQELHDRKAENQNHEITILQQQDELKVAGDRVGGLFQQLENSHQIGQRQQLLIESLSQQLEIAHAIIPQLEAENEELSQKYRQQSQKLDKTERVAVELHRRLKLQTGAMTRSTVPAENTNPAPELAKQAVTPPMTAPVTAEAEVTPPVNAPAATEAINFATSAPIPAPIESPAAALAGAISEAAISEDLSMETTPTASRSVVSPTAPIADRELPAWTPSTATRPQKTILSPPQTSWRDAIASNNSKYLDLPNLEAHSFAPKPPEITYGEIDIDEDDTSIAKPSPNWPSPTLDRNRPIAKAVTIDLPKFPKKQES